MSMELLKSMAGIDVMHVPYKGSTPALTDVISGQDAVMSVNMPPAVPHVKAGKLRALAVTTRTRTPSMPDLPTVAESLPGYETVAWFGVLAPAGTPQGRHQSPVGGDRADRALAGHARAARRDGRRARRRHAGGIRRGDGARHREVDGARQVRRHQDRLSDSAHAARLPMATIAAIEPVVVNVSPKTNWTFVAVTDGDGATGWGECSLNGWEELLVAETARLSRMARWPRCRPRERSRSAIFRIRPAGWSRMPCAARVEQALVDLARAARGRRDRRAFSHRRRDAPIPAYANINRSVTERTPAGFAAAARRASRPVIVR